MKKTAHKHNHSKKFNPTEFFTENIGFLGLLVVILFFVVYMLLQRLNNLEQKVVDMSLNGNTNSATEIIEE
jgi:hypothetical protein